MCPGHGPNTVGCDAICPGESDWYSLLRAANIHGRRETIAAHTEQVVVNLCSVHCDGDGECGTIWRLFQGAAPVDKPSGAEVARSPKFPSGSHEDFVARCSECSECRESG
ncbi:MAG: hypothetical protein JWO45_821 [Spartobacteria bacterium]|nr:hypothetical protein [Spartobacteria bacterium]